MKILLALPHDPTTDVTMPDLGLGYLASSLMKAGHDVELSIRKPEAASPEFFKRGGYDVVGVKVLSPGFKYAGRVIAAAKESGSGALIVAGGPHVSGAAGRLFSHFPDVSFGVRGEGEAPFVNLAQRLSDGGGGDFSDIPGLIWKRDGETVVNERSFVERLDELPFPAWELMDPRSFPPMPFNGYSRKHPIAPVLTSRGCPYKCTFCGNEKVNGRIFRGRSAGNIIEELNLLKSEYGVREIHFWDDNCAHPKGEMRVVMRRMIDENMKLSWCAPNGIRLDSIDPELPALMRASGCFQVNVGIESGSPRILKKIKKGITPEMVREKVPMLRKAGIEVIGFFMIGFPGETLEEINETVSLAMEASLNGASIAIFNPLPGTDLAAEVEGRDVEDADFYHKLDYIRYENNLSEVPYNELRRIQRSAYLRLHLRPAPLMTNIRNLNNMGKLRLILMRVKKLVFNRF